MQFNMYRDLQPKTKELLFPLTHANANTHVPSAVRGICVMGPSQEEPYERAYTYVYIYE